MNSWSPEGSLQIISFGEASFSVWWAALRSIYYVKLWISSVVTGASGSEESVTRHRLQWNLTWTSDAIGYNHKHSDSSVLDGLSISLRLSNHVYLQNKIKPSKEYWLLKTYFNFAHAWIFCLHACTCTMCVQCLGRPEPVTRSPEMELEMVVGHLSVLGTPPGSSARAHCSAPLCHLSSPSREHSRWHFIQSNACTKSMWKPSVWDN